jgi:hypothetical protein
MSYETLDDWGVSAGQYAAMHHLRTFFEADYVSGESIN